MRTTIREDEIEQIRVNDALEAEARAYKESMLYSVVQQAGYLLRALGQRVTAVGVGLSDARPVRAWQEGGDIREENERRLRLLFRLARTVALVYDDETARAFLRSSSPYLGDRSPLEVVAAGDETSAVEALRAFMEG